ncbi:hypothetical protein QZP90_06475 [Serratia marcescens]|uniref:hypothetical protein n=1 Tax=Serratia marcescens TaxID=615 RepID=UPI002759D29B|nr:hypothetical protein [Serratia marcescens]MDP8733164.1 hypothetical protein [Serratia marcescens]
MKFSDLRTETKEHARAALSAVIAKGSVSSDSAKLAGETIAAAFIAMEQYESEPAGKKVPIGDGANVNICITTKP